jgi:hypothetical protein
MAGSGMDGFRRCPVSFGVVHRIHDPEGWAKALDNEAPSDLHLHSCVEAEDRHVALCVWEAPSSDALQEFLDRFFGHAAVNEVFPVDLRVMGGHGIEDYVPGWRASISGR